MQDQDNIPHRENVTREALEAIKRGFQPIPLAENTRKPLIPRWIDLRWEKDEAGLSTAKEKFEEWADKGHSNLGLLLGEPSGGLVDVDLDHSTAVRLREFFLPRTMMRSGRTSRPMTHFWYLVEPDTVPGTRVYKLTDRETVSVELRSTGGQTCVPPSRLDDDEEYIWGGAPWGGDVGPARVDGRVLQVQVAVLGLAAALVDIWPGEGSRHAAYLALAGGLLRVGDGIHPYWEKNAPELIRAVAQTTQDDDGGNKRVSEVMETTLRRIRSGKTVQGFTTLGEMIGEKEVKHIRMLVGEVEAAAGVPDRGSGSLSVDKIAKVVEKREKEILQREKTYISLEADEDLNNDELDDLPDDEDEAGALRELDPLEDRLGSWEAVNLDPYLSGQVQPIFPTAMERTDGNNLMYHGRVNMLYGPSEAAKSWIAMLTSIQHIERGERVVYIDFEDEPINSLSRLKLLGASTDDIRNYFTYVLPEEPLAPMERSRWGEPASTEAGVLNLGLFEKLLERVDPTLIIADGISELYGLHGLDTNDTSHTATITRWMKGITRNGSTTVIAIDHTSKNPQRGTLPIGSQHKVSMVQGALIQAYPIAQPRPGAVGEVELIAVKDRPGNVRAIGENSGDKAQLVGRAVIDSTTEGRTVITINPPNVGAVTAPAKFTEEAAQKKVEISMEHLKAVREAEQFQREEDIVLSLFKGELGKQLTKRKMRELIYGADSTRKEYNELTKTIKRLIDRGQLLQLGTSSATRYELLISYEDDE